LSSAFYRALGKEDFAEHRTRQSPALSKELVYRVQDTRHRETLGKYCFAERQTLGKDDARQRAVSGRLQLTAVSLCRGSKAGTRQRGSLPSVFCGHSAKYIFIFLFCPPNFLWYVPTLCRPTCIFFLTFSLSHSVVPSAPCRHRALVMPRRRALALVAPRRARHRALPARDLALGPPHP
jgi:hypothetical protein